MAPLLNEARQNEVAAFAKYKGETLRVDGVAVHTGIDHFEHVVADGYGMGYGYGVGLSARRVFVAYPFVVLGDAGGKSADLVKCYFGTDDAEAVGRLNPGMRMILRGRFNQYVRDAGRLILMLGECSIE